MPDNKQMDEIRERATEASDESHGFLSKISPTYKAGADKDFNRAIKDFKKIPQETRDQAAYNQNGHKKGGVIKSKVRGHGIESRGKTKGRFV